MSIVLAIIVIYLIAWFCVSFRTFVTLFVTPWICYACIAWGSNFIDVELLSARIYGWLMIGAGAFVALGVLKVLCEVIDDVWYTLFPKQPPKSKVKPRKTS